jgi:hypothetical protein
VVFRFIVVVLVVIMVVKSQIYVDIERIKGESLEEKVEAVIGVEWKFGCLSEERPSSYLWGWFFRH